MKFTLSLVVLAAAASQAVAVVPTPIASCTRTVVVQMTDTDGCAAFAARNSVTFDDLLKWNLKLRRDCLNLDLGEKMCVSVAQGAAVPVSTPGASSGTKTTAPAGGAATATVTGTATPTPSATTGAPNNNGKPPTAAPGAASAQGAKSGASTTVVKALWTFGGAVVPAVLACVYVL
ncbi:hypothetical protein DFQ26_007579 [Actinomortierella ambigua]|nr:hypothetical protein DFQ26_007579 [Actinomortierella ambigua]